MIFYHCLVTLIKYLKIVQLVHCWCNVWVHRIKREYESARIYLFMNNFYCHYFDSVSWWGTDTFYILHFIRILVIKFQTKALVFPAILHFWCYQCFGILSQGKTLICSVGSQWFSLLTTEILKQNVLYNHVFKIIVIIFKTCTKRFVSEF